MRGNIQLKSGRNRMKCLLFAVLFLIAAVGVLTFSTVETQAATATKKTVKIKLADKSGICLIQVITGGSKIRVESALVDSITSKCRQEKA